MTRSAISKAIAIAIAIALALVSASASSFRAQAQTPSLPEPQPTFKSRAEVVVVDFVVSDKADRPVRGLSAKDFVVKEDGKERPIVSFTAIDGGNAAIAAAAAAGAAPAAAAMPTPTARPAMVLLVDDGHLSPKQAATVRPALKALLATAGRGAGAIALVAPLSKVSVAGVLPDSAAEFDSGIDRIAGHRFDDTSTFPIADAEALAAERGDTATLTRVSRRFLALNPSLTEETANMFAHNRAVDVAHDARGRRGVLYGVALLALDWLSKQPGRHSLVIVSPGFARESADSQYHEIVTRSMRVNAPIHFVDVRGLQGVGFHGVAYGFALDARSDATPFAWSDAAEGASTLADDTGGITIRNTNDIEKGLGRVVESMSTYYILGYDAPAHDKPGFKKIAVASKIRGMHIRARRGYYVP